MGSEKWEHKQLRSVISKVVDNRGKTPVNSVNGEHELIEVNAISNTYKYPQYKDVRKYVDDQTYNTWFRAGHPIIGDVLVPTVGSLGAVSYVNENRGCIAQNLIALRANTEFCTGQFLYYSLRNPILRQELLNLDIGGVQPSIKVPHLLGLTLGFPPVMEQNKIAATLSSLDDKIELNNRIIANLEAQAQAIFDEWFMAVDVDFPVGVLSDIAEVNPTRTLSKGQLATYIEMSSLSTSNSFPDNWVENTPFNGGMKFKNGDTVIARITPCLENGKTAYITCLEDGAVGFGSTEYVVLSAKEDFCNEMLYFLARNEDFRNYAIQNMNGSSGRQRVSGETIGNYEMAVPTKEASKQFEAVAKPIMETIHNCAIQNRKLAQTRDILLPKLMSGEIEVPVEG